MNKEEETLKRNGKCDNIKSDTIKNRTFTRMEIIQECEISRSRSGEYEDVRLLGSCAM